MALSQSQPAPTSSTELRLGEMFVTVAENPSVENFKRIHTFLKQLVTDTKREHPIHFTPAYAANVAKALMQYVGQLESKTERKLLETAEIALEAFYLLINEVPEVQDAVAAMPLSQFTVFNFDLHVLEGTTMEHRTIAARFLQLLPLLSPKFADYQTYVRRAKEVKKFVEGLAPPTETPGTRRRMSVEGHMSPQSGTYYDVDVSAVCEAFGTDLEKGLSTEEVEERRKIYGPNELPKPKPRPTWRILIDQFLDFMVLVLVLAAIASAAVKEFKGTITLAIVIVVNAIIGFVQEYKAEKALNSLMSLDVPKAKVIRNGELTDIPAVELVPGDLVVLDEGDDVPADVRLIEAVNLSIIEAVLTGESEPVHKHTEQIFKKDLPLGERKNMAYMSTSVVKGRGKGIVVTTSVGTEAGKIQAHLAKAKQPKTPLQKRLAVLGRWLVFVALFVAALIVAIGLIRGREATEMVLIGVSLGVSVIPEGLATVVVVTMALGVRRMAKKNAIVRRLVAVENLGSVSTICSDKTGTLTEGKMRATDIWVAESNTYYVITGAGDAPDGNVMEKNNEEVVISPKNVPAQLKMALMICALCNNAAVRKSEEHDGYDCIGDPTEVAIMLAAMKAGLNKDYWKKKYKFVSEIAFDSNRKRMSVVYKEKKSNVHYVLVKGGLESVIGLCKYVTSGDTTKPITKKDTAKIEKASNKMANAGLRVLSLAYRVDENPSEDTDWTKESKVESKLVFAGLIGIIDPPRKEVADAIKRCYAAGIRVVMITGDHQATAESIAAKLGIHNPYGRAVRGVEIDLLAQEDALDTLTPFPTIFARVSPENKLQIVEVLQAQGEIVAMTGDGVNDAPAIKKSDVGIAMGKTGTDITKASASIVLRDDNFDTITRAVEEGRVIYENILKFILYLLSCNSAELIMVLVSIIVGAPSPFTTIQILWANIIADVPPAMALGIDPPEPDVMSKPPRPPSQGILTKETLALILGHGLDMCGIGLAAYFFSLYVQEYNIEDKEYTGPNSLIHAQTSAWTTLTVVQIYHGLLARSKLSSVFQVGVFRNIWMIVAICVSMVFLVGGIYIPKVNEFLELYPLDGWDWLKVLIGIVAHTLISETLKLILRSCFTCCNKENKRSLAAELKTLDAASSSDSDDKV